MAATWTPKKVRTLRRALGENTVTFGARFGRSGRTVECWEQGTRNPDVMVRRELDRIDALDARRRRT